MSASPLIWVTAGGLSIALNAGLAGLLGLSIDPKPVTPQPRPESRIELAAYPVKRETANAQDTSGMTAAESENSGSSLAGGAIPSTKTSGVTPEKTITKFLEPKAPTAVGQNPIASRLEPLNASTKATETAPTALKLSASSMTTDAIPTKTPPSMVTLALNSPNVVVSAAVPVSNQATAVSANVAITTPKAARSELANSIQPAGDTAQNITPTIEMASAAQIVSERQTAALAWSSDGQDALDPASLAAIQSFMTEGELSQSDQNIGAVRDGIDALLAQVPCARLQVEFSPDTGQLELRGHIPEDGLRAPIRDALQARIGASIPVADNLLILPRPQCGALAGIANAGLPQSTDQQTNPRLIGPDTHTRLYGFVEGERLVFDLVAPDYDAFIYVDYFDAAGNVIHLVPNARVTLERFAAKSTLQIGADRADQNFLAVNIGPPFGQEIAAAFASSVPLFEGARPLVEPAAAYLEWLQEQVAQARETTPDFKGEWVYFFVKTEAK